MRTILKFSLVIIALLLVVNVNAQEKPATFGVKAGMNLSTITGDETDDVKAKIGFNVGVTLDYTLTSDLYLLTGLELSTKGCKEDVGLSKDATSNLMYLQLPIHLGYKLAVTDATKMVFHAGPYLAYGIGGKTKISESGVEVSVNSFGSNRLKRFDFGVGLGVGAEFGKIGVGLGYDFGLVNIVDVDNVSNKNANAYLTVGYKF